MAEKKEFPTWQVLELACAAQRINGSYVKEGEAVYSQDGKFMYMKTANKLLMQLTLDIVKWNGPTQEQPALLKPNDDDKELASEILKYFRRLMFAAIEGDSEFLTSINSILQSENTKENQFGYVACLPSVYKRDYATHNTKKRSKTVDLEFLAEVDEWLNDLDCEVLESIKSKNFEGYNICAIIDNKMVSWISKKDLKLGACVVVKCKIKDHSKHWKHENPVTRLNYVKAAQ